ncbi:MAG: NAD-binding protein [Actinomycetota bacterium]|nr:NAD-binding protein [Actinomycetota bacterium]
MSFLIVGEDNVIEAVVDALVGDHDLVRVVTQDAARAARLKDRGAFVAVGDPADPDLVQRAGQGARTAVLFDDTSITADLIDALSAARISRIVYAGRDADTVELVSHSGLEFVILRRRRRLFGKRDGEMLVAAIVAADDLAGAPRLTIDLSDDAALGELIQD